MDKPGAKPDKYDQHAAYQCPAQKPEVVERCGKESPGVEKYHTRTVKREPAGPLFDSVEVEFVVERLAVDAEEFGRLRLVAGCGRQGPPDLLLLGDGVVQRIGGG